MAGDLVTAADLKLWLGSLGSADDAILEELARTASDDFKRACAQSIAADDYTEAIDGAGRREVYLSEAPLVSIASIVDDGTAIAASEYVFYSRPPRIRLKAGRFSTVPQGVLVAYRAGYETIPADVKAACSALGVFLFHRRRNLGKSSETVAGMSLSIDNALPPAVAAVARRYSKTWGLFG